MSKLKLGMVGSGFISHFHSVAIEQIREFDIEAIFSTNEESAKEFSASINERKLGSGVVYNDFNKFVNSVDVIALNCPNYTRIEVLENILKAVKESNHKLKGIVCEKPLGRNLAEARKHVEIAKEIGCPTAYLENQIFMKSIQAQKDQLKAQEQSMGPLSLTRSAEEHGGPHSNWFWDPTLQGGGVLSDMGCHSIAVGWYVLTPSGKPLTHLKPISVNCELGLLKWGEPEWKKKLKDERGVDYDQTPAEDFATGIVSFKNPDTGQIVKAQFTDSWMFEKQGLRLFMDGMGPGYAFEVNTLVSPLNIFISDEASDRVADGELALEKSTSTKGLLAVQYNEADLYGYTDELKDAAISFANGKDGLLNFDYGVEIMKLVMASYLSSEKKKTIDLTDPQILQELETYIPLIQQGKGREVLFPNK